MSLTSFIDLKDVKERLKPLRPEQSRKIPVELQAEPRTGHHTVVGTAFDYLLRFELERRAPHATTNQWIAEAALGRMPLVVGDPDVLKQAERVISNARDAVAAYIVDLDPAPETQAQLASHAIRLAKLDPIFRALYFDPSFDTVDEDDVEDVLAMLSIVPFDRLVDSRFMSLNPTFGRSSVLVGGADADLISGGLLVDTKSTKKPSISPNDLDQVLGYYLLSRHERTEDISIPEIKEVGIYYSRYGYLWNMSVDVWTEHDQFPVVEEWFFKRAAEVFQPHAKLRRAQVSG